MLIFLHGGKLQTLWFCLFEAIQLLCLDSSPENTGSSPMHNPQLPCQLQNLPATLPLPLGSSFGRDTPHCIGWNSFTNNSRTITETHLKDEPAATHTGGRGQRGTGTGPMRMSGVLGMRVPVCTIPKAGGLMFYWPGFEHARDDLDDQKTKGSSED